MKSCTCATKSIFYTSCTKRFLKMIWARIHLNLWISTLRIFNVCESNTTCTLSQTEICALYVVVNFWNHVLIRWLKMSQKIREIARTLPLLYFIFRNVIEVFIAVPFDRSSALCNWSYKTAERKLQHMKLCNNKKNSKINVLVL